MNGSPGISAGWVRFARTMVLFFIPIILILSSVFLILITAKAWIPIEYRMPGFPDDPYGFTTEDRIYWSGVDIDFLLGDHDISYFDDFTLADSSPMHNQRELQHLEDVVSVLGSVRLVWWIGLLIILGSASVIWRVEGSNAALSIVKRGGLWLILLIGGLAVLIAVAFEFLFVGFHELLFDPGTWTFPYSDTFIRLYPQRFWRDTFALVAGVSVLLGGLVYLIPHLLLRRRQG
jgi:integral membrane protein (TIGR01906 family)